MVQGLSNRVIYLHFDYLDDAPSRRADTGGKNPFRDKRVREAISKAIDREAIVARIMGGVAVPAGELLPTVMFGTNKDMNAPKLDVEGAKKLLAEAGYPNGFSLTLATPNDRYVNDAQIAAGGGADADAGVGVKVTLDAMTQSHVLRQAQQARVRLLARRLGLGHRRDVVAAEVADRDAEPRQGHGHDQFGRLFQRRVDAMLAEGARHRRRRQARRRCWRRRAASRWRTTARIPLHFEMTTWAFRRSSAYTPRADQNTQAHAVKRAK